MSKYKRYSVVDEVFQLRKEYTQLRKACKKVYDILLSRDNYGIADALDILEAALADTEDSDE